MIEAVAGRLEGAPREVRRWSDEFKAQAVAESMEPGASVSAVARRIGIDPSQLFTWRRSDPRECRDRRAPSRQADPRGTLCMIPAGTKVFLASHPVDFRKGPDSLLALVRDAGSDPFNGSLYVFRAKRADRIKIAWWDGSGVCLYSKRLEKNQFVWPKIGPSRVQLNHAQLMALVDGMDWKRVRTVAVKRPEFVG